MIVSRQWKWVSRAGRLVLIIFYGVPLLWILVTSFKSETELGQSMSSLVFAPTFSAYQNITNTLVEPIVRSIEISIGTVIVVVVLSVLTGYGLSRLRGRAAKWVISGAMGLLVLLQLVPQPTAVIPIYGVLASWHLINSIPGIIFADSALLLPLAVLLLRPFFFSIPRELEDAAFVDGANPFVVLIRIVVPLITNGLVTVAVLIFSITWGEFIYAATFLNSSDLIPVSVILLNQVGAETANWGGLMALAVVTSLPLLVVFFVSQRRLREGLLVGAIR